VTSATSPAAIIRFLLSVAPGEKLALVGVNGAGKNHAVKPCGVFISPFGPRSHKRVDIALRREDCTPRSRRYSSHHDPTLFPGRIVALASADERTGGVVDSCAGGVYDECGRCPGDSTRR
jgi:ABC-type taurine transport system ATPase subunit